MSYQIDLSINALNGIERLRKSGEKQTQEKLSSLIDELKEHPYTGTGKPERLKYNLAGKWSREITKKHRLVYEVREETITVVVIQTFGHYLDK
jgi:toxin YoeB